MIRSVFKINLFNCDWQVLSIKYAYTAQYKHNELMHKIDNNKQPSIKNKHFEPMWTYRQSS